MKVMVVDDDPSVPASVKYLLDIIGADASVIGADSGQMCLDTVKDMKPDIILMDILMPGMGGREVAAKLRRDEDTKDTPIIFITGKTEEDRIARGDIAPEDVIEKPFYAMCIWERIMNAVKVGGGHA